LTPQDRLLAHAVSILSATLTVGCEQFDLSTGFLEPELRCLQAGEHVQ